MRKLFQLLSFLILMTGVCFISVTNHVFANDENEVDKSDIDIRISPEDAFFDIGNMKPGDWAPRTITVKNLGNLDFEYQMQIKNNGEKKLFNELLLEVTVDNTELYVGKLAAFKSLPARKLTSGNEENLDITIRFPEHLGNDFQGLESAFVISFSAEGKDNTLAHATTVAQIDSGNPTSTGFSLPNTSTNIFNLMLMGTVLMAGGIVVMIIRHFRRIKVAQ